MSEEFVKYVKCEGFGGVEVMKIAEQQPPKLEQGSGQVYFRLAATGINRAEILQRQGKYPPSKTGSDVLGLEGSGYILDEKMQVKSKGLALLNGGGYSQLTLVDRRHVIEVSEDFDLIQGAAIPEAWITAYLILRQIGKFEKGQTALIYAGASGVGTAAIQLAKYFGGQSIVTVSSEDKEQFCSKLGASHTINYKVLNNEQVIQRINEATSNRGVDIVLDCVGASNYEISINSLNLDSKWILYGSMGGMNVTNFNLAKLLQKRVQFISSTLKTRSDDFKAELIENFKRDVVPGLLSGELKPVINSVYKLDWNNPSSIEQLQKAHLEVEANLNKGKVVIEFQN